ncbi:hypothetical protein ADIS_3249 [Lunatimonas lonarensis]|uniref:Uncharacterized protein n=1 Tax=Lunatimonas lonarensis TaxID=1232681 RepID=R7ZPS7_9BACT|nr:hypothetical protein ADIS_3249 [Lunatimonas lonarensis]
MGIHDSVSGKTIGFYHLIVSGVFFELIEIYQYLQLFN